MSGLYGRIIPVMLLAVPFVGNAGVQVPPSILGHWKNEMPGCKHLCGFTVVACEASYHQLYMAYDKGQFQAEASGHLRKVGEGQYIQTVAGVPVDFTLKDDKLCAGKKDADDLCQVPGTVFKKSPTTGDEGAGVTCSMAKIILDNTIPK